jgi:hypothetical protein
VLEAFQPHQLQQRLGTMRRRVPLAPAAHLEGQRDVADGVAPEEEAGMLEHEAELARQPRAPGRSTAHLESAARGLEHIGHEAQQRRLAAARGPDEGDQLAAPHLEGDAVERSDASRRRGEHHGDIATGDVDDGTRHDGRLRAAPDFPTLVALRRSCGAPRVRRTHF